MEKFLYDVKEKHGKVEKQTGDRVWYFCKMYENQIEAEEILFIYIFIFPRTLILHFPRLLSSFFFFFFIFILLENYFAIVTLL